jgi:integrase
MESLLAVRDLALVPDEETLAAIRGYHPRIREFLDGAGLIPREAEERTVHQCLDAFLEVKQGQCKHSSMEVLGSAVKRAKKFFHADKELQSVTPLEVDAFGNWLNSLPGRQSPGLAEATARKTCSVLCQAFRFAVRNGWLRRNAVLESSVKRSFTTNPKRGSYVSLSEASQLLAACESREERLMVGFARFAGLRMPSEIRELRWSDFKHDLAVVEIHATKTDKPRSVPVMPSLRELLLEEQPPSDESEFVFPRLRQYPSLSTAMRRIIRKSGIKSYPRALHTLRRSCITDWVSVHTTIAEVAEWAGHGVPVMTKHYLSNQSDQSALLAAKAAREAARNERGDGAGSVRAA